MSKYKKFWGFFFSILFLWLALRGIDFYAIPDAILAMDPTYFVLVLLSYTLEMITRTYRWLIIQPAEKMTFKYSFYGLLLTFFFNNILPARAGEFFKPFYYAKKGIADSGETLGAVVLERFFDGVMLITLILISFQTFAQSEMLKQAGIITAVFYALVLVGIILAIFKRNIFELITEKIISILPSKIRNFLKNLISKFVDGLSTIKDFKRLVKIIVSSAFCWASSVLTMWLCLKGFGFGENIIQASFILTVLSISSMIPASPGVLGVYEYLCVFTLTKVLGHTENESMAFAIVMHGVQYFYILIFGIIILCLEGIKISEFNPNYEKMKTENEKVKD